METLEQRFDQISERIARLEKELASCGGGLGSQAGKTELTSKRKTNLKNGFVELQPDGRGAFSIPRHPIPTSTSTIGPIEDKLTKELIAKKFTGFKFVRCPPNYYEEPLEFRRGCLDAPTIEHLCKSMVMVNTKAQDHITDCSNLRNSKYYLVILQYVEDRIHAEKLKSFLHKLNEGMVPKKNFNIRLAPEEISDQLSGYEHNAVTPIGIKTKMPIILSHRIANLNPGFFFIGAGEVDLKVGLRVDEFVREYEPHVVDCTYN